MSLTRGMEQHRCQGRKQVAGISTPASLHVLTALQHHPQLLQFRLHGEQECQQSGIQKGIQALFNTERERALKGVCYFPISSFAKKTEDG